MSKTVTLHGSYNQTTYQVAGHGIRDVQVLKEAFKNIDGSLVSDIYGSGKIIEDFQIKMASLLGKEKAVFFPSGTMAQQIALRIWCDEKGSPKVAYHPLCHLEIHEEDGLKELHKIETVLLADKNRVIDLEDVLGMEEGISCLLLELPQREIGGQLPSFETLVHIFEHCRKNGIRLHLDGARLLEVLPYYKKTATEVCELFDSVYMSFYKGVGGIAGAILAGETEFIEKSKVWKRRYGGDLISLYPYILSADYYFDRRAHKMTQYYEAAMELAQLYNSCHDISTLPAVPVSNMFHVHIPHAKADVEPVIIQIQEQTGLGITNHLRETGEHSCYFEISLGDRFADVPKESLLQAFKLLDEKMKQTFKR